MLAAAGLLSQGIARADGSNASKSKSASESQAETPSTPKKEDPQPGGAKRKQAKAQEAERAERETAALELAREHHEELIELLEQLKTNKPKQYQQAIQELWHASERLARIRQRDPDRYELELKAWKVDSRVRLLAAKLSQNDDTLTQEQLKAALTERAEVRLRLKTLERDRVKSRFEALSAEIDKLQSHRDEQVQQAYDKLLRAATKRKAKGPAPNAAARREAPTTQSTDGN
jgi:hypothetical protein